MASIRRTLSPLPERRNQNGTSGESMSPHRLGKDSSVSSFLYLPTVGVGFRRFLASILQIKNTKKPPASWRRSLRRCLLFFLCGLLLGMTPFGYVHDLRTRDFSFEIKPPFVNTQMEVKTDHYTSGNDPTLDGDINRGVQLQGAVFGLKHEVKVDLEARKQLIVVTPTYNRASQAYFMNRIGQVLRLVKPPLLWIVVEMNAASTETAEILRNTEVLYRHLVCTKNTTNVKDRGVHQRNTALEHIQLHHLDGIVYFADDDNIYSLELFENLRRISRFGTWPVAMLAPGKNKAILEGPVCNRSHVIGWHTNDKSKRLRRFHVDMSGFAFNSTIIWDPKRWGRHKKDPIRQLDTVREGFQETTFIEQVVEDERQMEAIPDSCSRIMNWHLHLDVHNRVYPKGWKLQKNLDAVISIT